MGSEMCIRDRINVAERKAAQIIVEGAEVKYPIYEMIKSGMEKAGE